MGEPTTDQVETQADSPDTKSHGIFGWLFWPSILLLVYVLSAGPAVKLADANIIPFSIVLTIYSPLETLGDVCPPAKRLLAWYVGLWETPRHLRTNKRLPSS
jgi:hypothetical protein